MLTFQDHKSVILLLEVKDILDPVCKLALQLQHYNAALWDVPDFLKINLIQESTFPILDSTKYTDQEIHKV